MNIKYKRLLLFFVNALETPFDQRIREQPEVAAAAYWNIGAENLNSRKWKFNQRVRSEE